MGIFFLKQQGKWVFQWQVLFHLQNRISVFWNFKYVHRMFMWKCCENVHYAHEINLISYETLIKAFYLPSKKKQNKSKTWICGRKTAEDDNTKINVSPNIPCISLPFRSSAFVQIFFLRKSKFWERQFLSIVNVWHSFTY